MLAGAALFWSVSFLLGMKMPPAPQNQSSAQEGRSPASGTDYIGCAVSVAEAIRDRDYAALAGWIDLSEGLYIVPFSTVDFDRNLRFTASQVKSFGEDKTTYLWGLNPDSDKPIELIPADFFEAYLRTRDFSAAEIIGNNKVVRTGNAVENVADAFSDAYFVDLFFSSTDPSLADWASLKLVFRTNESGTQRLIAIIHSANTLQ